MNTLKKLNLGCGKKYLEGWVNLDISYKDIYENKIKVDIKHDLNKFPWPFKDNEFDIILLEHNLEHLKDIYKVMKELTRISKNGGRIKIITPHFSCYLAYRDPTHLHYFSRDSIDYFKGKNIVLSKRLKASHNKFIDIFSSLINKFPVIYERFFYGFFPVQENIWELEVKK